MTKILHQNLTNYPIVKCSGEKSLDRNTKLPFTRAVLIPNYNILSRHVRHCFLPFPCILSFAGLPKLDTILSAEMI